VIVVLAPAWSGSQVAALSSRAMTADRWDEPLEEAHDVYVTFGDRLELSTAARSDLDGERIARREGERWRWLRPKRVVLLVNGAMLGDDQLVDDDDRFAISHISGGRIEGHVRAKPARLALNRATGSPGERALQTWREQRWSVGIEQLRRRAHWLVFPGPGGRTRALSATRPVDLPAYAVASPALARSVDVIDVIADGTCFVRNAGVASLGEILKSTVVQSARLEVAVAINVVRRLLDCEAMPGAISVDDAGEMTVHAEQRLTMSATDTARVLAWLLGARSTNGDIVEQLAIADRDLRHGLRRLLTLADSATPQSYRSELKALPVAHVDNDALGAVVRGLFPERIRQERELREQLAMLDPDDVAALLR
jgi:hypothetical protein